MTNPTIPQTVRFPDLFDKPLVATFNREQASSDGGAVLLKAAERVYGLVKAFARCLVDKRLHAAEPVDGARPVEALQAPTSPVEHGLPVTTHAVTGLAAGA